ncbi:hypothetical protein ACVWY2_002805 [Bradyrhizobium sp. JR6.1]
MLVNTVRDAAVEGLDVIETRQHAGAAMRDIGRKRREIGTHVAHQVDIHAEEFAVLGERHLRGGEVVAALRVAHEMVGALGGPFDGLLELARRDRDQGILAIGKQLGAEAAADIRADHPHVFLRHLQDHVAEDLAQAVAALAADRQRQMILLGVVLGDRGAGLHEIGNDARIDDGDLGYRMRLGEGGLGRALVADRDVEQQIAGLVRPHLRRALLHRIHQAGHRRQRRPLDVDGLDRVAGMIDGIGDHKGDGVADMAHLILGEDRIRRCGERIGFEIEQARQAAELGDIGRGQDQRHAGHAAGLAGIDRVGRVRMRRAQHQRVQCGRRCNVVGIAALAANQSVILLASHTLSDAELDGSCHRLSNCLGCLYAYWRGCQRSANAFLGSFCPLRSGPRRL